jgi:hypothetical protein
MKKILFLMTMVISLMMFTSCEQSEFTMEVLPTSIDIEVGDTISLDSVKVTVMENGIPMEGVGVEYSSRNGLIVIKDGNMTVTNDTMILFGRYDSINHEKKDTITVTYKVNDKKTISESFEVNVYDIVFDEMKINREYTIIIFYKKDESYEFSSENGTFNTRGTFNFKEVKYNDETNSDKEYKTGKFNMNYDQSIQEYLINGYFNDKIDNDKLYTFKFEGKE